MVHSCLMDGIDLPVMIRSMEWSFLFHVGIPEIGNQSTDQEAKGNNPSVGHKKFPGFHSSSPMICPPD